MAGKISGTIRTEENETIELLFEHGLLEQHYAKW